MSEPSLMKESRLSSHDSGNVRVQTVRINSIRPTSNSFDQKKNWQLHYAPIRGASDGKTAVSSAFSASEALLLHASQGPLPQLRAF